MTSEPTSAAPSQPSPDASDRDVLQLLSYLHVALGILIVMLALVPAVVLGVGAELGAAGGDEMVRTEGARAAAAFSLALVGGVLVAAIVAAAIVIWGARALVTRRGWPRAVGSTIVLCFFFPFGTLVGGYTLTRLLDPATRSTFH